MSNSSTQSTSASVPAGSRPDEKPEESAVGEDVPQHKFATQNSRIRVPPTEEKRTSSNSQETVPQYDPAYEVVWDEPTDSTFPRNLPVWRKWAIVLINASTALCVTCTSSLYTSTYGQLTEEFGVSRLVATLGLSLFIFALGASPMFLAPLSEFYGRKPIYVVSLTLFTIWLVPCAVAQNIQTELVARFFDGFAGAAFLTVAGGTVGDVFDKMNLQGPMLIFSSAPFLGPVIGPVLGGFINEFTNWRWSFWTLLIWSGVQWVLVIFVVPETYHPVLLRNKAKKARKETGDNRWHAPIEKLDRSVTKTVLRSFYRPFILLAFEPMVLNLCLLSALLLGIIYLFFGAFVLVFQNNHGFSLYQTGLSFLGIGVGMLIGIASDPLWQKNYKRLVDHRKKFGAGLPETEPEFRLPPACFGAPLATIGLFWFGWTQFSSIHWIVAIIGSSLFGMGTLLMFFGIFTFLVDAYPLYAASALAANSFSRSSFAAAFPLFGIQMYERLGYQWATTLLALLSLIMAPFPYIFYRHGSKIRKRSKYAYVVK